MPKRKVDLEAVPVVLYWTPEQYDAFRARLNEPARTIPALVRLQKEVNAEPTDAFPRKQK